MVGFPGDVWEMGVTYLPGPIGYVLRRQLWRGRLRRMGRGVVIDVGVRIHGARYVSLDDGCWIDRNVTIIAGSPSRERITYRKENPAFPLGVGEVYIGKNTHVAPNTVLSGIGGLWVGCNCSIAAGAMVYSFSHHYRNLVNREDRHQYSFTSCARPDQQAMILGPVVVGDYGAIGLNAVVLPGTNVMRGAWVGAGCVVSGEVPEQTVLTQRPEGRMKSIAELTIKE